MNIFKTMILLTALTLLLMFVGRAVGGPEGMSFAFMMACVMNFGAYWFSDKLVLAMYGARPVSSQEAPELYGILSELTAKAGMPMPKVYRIPTQMPNAFATGRDPAHAAVAVTDGILEILSWEELRAVLAHELSHVHHRDILISTIAAVLAGTISMISDLLRWSFMWGGYSRNEREEGRAHPAVLLITAFLAPLAAMLVQLAVSRSREFHADEGGAHLSGDPLSLASALIKLENAAGRSRTLERNPSSAHLFIVNPLRGEGFMRLFSTHPSTAERVARLETMARSR